MFRLRACRLTILMLAVLLPAGGTSASGLQLPELTPREVQARFEGFVQAHGLDIDHYRLQSMTYDYVTGEWLVYYLGKGSDFDDFLYLLRNREGEISHLN